MRETFPRAARVRKRKDFRQIERAGRRFAGRLFVVLAVLGARAADGARVGVTVSKKVGGAVGRNLVKRRIRECYRRAIAGQRDDEEKRALSETGADLRGSLRGLDLVVIARPGAAEASFQTSRAELLRLFEQAGRGVRR